MNGVLVACRDPLRADAAIALARVLVPDPSVPWTLATVVVPDLTASPAPLDRQAAWAEAHRVLDRIARRAGARKEAELRVLGGATVAGALASFCEQNSPCLAVVGPTRRRFRPGVGPQLAARGRVAVGVVPAHGPPAPGRVRGVGLVFSTSQASEGALRHAAQLAAAHDGTLRVLVHPGERTQRALAARRPRTRDLVIERLETKLAEAWARLPHKPAASAVLRCEPLPEAVDEEMRRGLDVLVVPVPNALTGPATAWALARLGVVAGCPVVAVPALQDRTQITASATRGALAP